MTLKEELGYINPISTLAHETALNIALTGHLLSKSAYLLLRPYGLTDTQFNVLLLLRYQAPSGAIAHKDLVRMLLVNRSNISGLVDRLSSMGLIQISESPTDGRVKMLQLSDKGKALLDKVEPVYDSAVERLIGCLTMKEQTALCKMMEKLRKSVKDDIGE